MSGISTIKALSVPLAAILALAAASTASADELTSIIGGTVYDTSGQKMVSKKSDYEYTGKFITPVDHIITTNEKKATSSDLVKYYYKNKNKGTATVIIKGINAKGFKDSILISYKIGGGNPRNSSHNNNSGSGSNSSNSSNSRGNSQTTAAPNLSKATVIAIPDQTYTGKALMPAVSLRYNNKVVPASYYTKTYSNNVNPGTASVKLTPTAASGFTGTKTVTFKIVAPGNGSFKVGTIAAQAYTGKAITPKPAVSSGNASLKLD